jgi:predicted Rdx family selenoprotein
VRAFLENKGVRSFDIRSGGSGQFDVAVDGRLVFSRHASGGFPGDAEMLSWLPAGGGAASR